MDKRILTVSIVAIIVVGGFFLLKRDVPVFGSVAISNEYQATTTYPGAWPVATTWVVNVPKVLKDSGGTLGSVIITGAAAAGNLTLYDATTTNTNFRYPTATTTLATFPVNAAAGTYTFDLVFFQGLIAE